MNFYITVLKKYAVFTGRASREEYWYFILLSTLITILLLFLDKKSELAGIYSLAVFIPSLAVSVRRLHDIGKSGWMFLITLIPIVGAIWLLVLLVRESDQGKNEYGPALKEVPNAYP